MNECGVCKSKIKSLLYCNGCFQRAMSVAERRGRIEELIRLKVRGNYALDLYIEKRLLELEKGELK